MPRLFARGRAARDQQEEELELPAVPTDPVKIIVLQTTIITPVGIFMEYKV